ncbi:photosystem I assembly protein Ycf3, partial [Pantanalinema sp. GBBB05]|uniref:photosystem I assembly protein Ycf3 n=1 Tax=Pantanalinema sp. GBBB05 TaxID=2604139 RepID=UPI003D81634D
VREMRGWGDGDRECFTEGLCSATLVDVLRSRLRLAFTTKLSMPRSQRNDNFIDKSFTVMADLILKLMPATQKEKEAFAYYRDGMSAQADGEYAEALENYYEALKLEEDEYDRSYILYNIGLIHASNGEHDRALEYYHQAIEMNPRLPQALNNIAVIYHYKGDRAKEEGQDEEANGWYDQAAEFWKRAIRIAPNNYIEAQNWLKTSGRSQMDVFF